MDKKTGFKECSRCGLRNKPTAKVCDFCGQRFEVNDDWEQQIDALEKLSKSGRKVEVSEDLSKKIEATIVTKTMVESKERAEAVKPVEPVLVKPTPQEPLPEPARPTPQPVHVQPPPPPRQETVVVAPKPAPVEKQVEQPAATVELEPIIETVEPLPEEEFVEVPVETIKVTKRMEKRKPKVTPSSRFFRWGLNPKDSTSFVFAALLFVGIIAYIVSLVMAGSMGSMVSWGFTVVSGLLIVMGFSQIGINWEVAEEPVHIDIPGTADDEVVEICPSCHERVTPDTDRCPACGTEFEPSEDQ